MRDNITKWTQKAFNSSSLNESRWPWVDYLKGIAILLVVYRHVFIGIERNGIAIPQPLIHANMIFFSFRMPLFFLLSGLFISRSLTKRSLRELVTIKFDKLMYPYFIWAFIQVTLQILVPYSSLISGDATYINAERTIKDYLYILYNPIKIDQFWYFPALFNASIIFLLIKKKIQPPAWAHLLLAAGIYFAAPALTGISILSDWMHFYLYFVAGDLLGNVLLKEGTYRLFLRNSILLIILPLFLLTQFYYLNYQISSLERLPIVCTGCLLMMIISFRLQQKNILRFLRILGYHSLQIYVMHVIASAFIRIILIKFLHFYEPSILLISGILFGVLIPVIVYNLLLKKHAWFLFSYRKPKPVMVRKDKAVATVS